jgi:hypothetical protein
MKLLKLMPILAMLCLGVMSSCVTEDETIFMTPTAKLRTQHPTATNQSPRPVNIGTAEGFAILTKSGVTNVPQSLITGNVGTSPIAQTAITGFALTLDSSGTFATSSQVAGKIYAASAAAPTPAMLTTAVLDMQTAYTDAAGRSTPSSLNVGAGIIGGLTFAPGLHKWTSTLLIPTEIYLDGGPNDVWIFQVAGTLTMSSAVRMTLLNGAKAKNIFWQVSGAVTLGTTSHFEGILLGATSIAVQTGATVNGRLLAQTAVTLQMNTVTEPEPEPVTAAIGDLRNGGVVFWVDPDDNTHGLVCALSDFPNRVKWECMSDLQSVPNVLYNGGIPNGPGAEIGDGMSNTNHILTDCSTATAALAARSFGSEWFLPSIKELNEIYVNKATLQGVLGVNVFSNAYWSSTETGYGNAWYQNFSSGNQNTDSKTVTYYVRAVRAF